MSDRENNKLYTKKEISIILNNATIAALRPSTLGEISDERIRTLKEYTMALIEPCGEHLDEGLLKPEELVAVFTAAAYLVHVRDVMKKDTLPAGFFVSGLKN